MSVIRSGKVREKVNREKPTRKRTGGDNLNKNQIQTYQMLLYVMPIFLIFLMFVMNLFPGLQIVLSHPLFFLLCISSNSKSTEMVSIHCS